MKARLRPAFGGPGQALGVLFALPVPQSEHPHPEMHPEGRQAVQPGKRLSYQERKKLKSGKEVLFLEKLALREGDRPSLIMIGFLY